MTRLAKLAPSFTSRLRPHALASSLLLFGVTVFAQNATPPPATPPAATPTTAPDARKTPEPATTATPAVTDPRQEQIIADTQKLLKLSQELKAEVAKSNKDTLSLTVIKKAQEVEKLARTLKEELNKAR